MPRGNPEIGGLDPMETDELSWSPVSTLRSQDTRIARSTDTKYSPSVPPGHFHHGAMRRTHSQRSQTLEPTTLTPEMLRRLDRINWSLHLYPDDLAQSRDTEHLAFQSLPTPIQHLVRELPKVEREIMTGARYIGTEVEQIITRPVPVEATTKGLHKALRRVSWRMDGQDNRQTQHEQVMSHLHQTREAEAAAAMGRDEHLGQELLDTKAQHQCEPQNQERIVNAGMAELEAN